MLPADEVPASPTAEGQANLYKAAYGRRQVQELDIAPVRTTTLEPFKPCDFGVEIGGRPSYTDLPRIPYPSTTKTLRRFHNAPESRKGIR
jgi:hypothetical protein